MVWQASRWKHSSSWTDEVVASGPASQWNYAPKGIQEQVEECRSSLALAQKGGRIAVASCLQTKLAKLVASAAATLQEETTRKVLPVTSTVPLRGWSDCEAGQGQGADTWKAAHWQRGGDSREITCQGSNGHGNWLHSKSCATSSCVINAREEVAVHKTDETTVVGKLSKLRARKRARRLDTTSVKKASGQLATGKRRTKVHSAEVLCTNQRAEPEKTVKLNHDLERSDVSDDFFESGEELIPDAPLVLDVKQETLPRDREKPSRGDRRRRRRLRLERMREQKLQWHPSWVASQSARVSGELGRGARWMGRHQVFESDPDDIGVRGSTHSRRRSTLRESATTDKLMASSVKLRGTRSSRETRRKHRKQPSHETQ